MPVITDTRLFPVLVRQIGDFLSKDECARIVAELDLLELAAHELLTGDAASSFHPGIRNSRNVLDEIEKTVAIKDRTFYQINAYARDFGTRPIRLDNSWINIQRKGSRLDYHTHPTSVVSGALFLKIDERSSPTSFRNPNPFLDVTEIRNWTDYTFKTASFKPVVGTLLLFPSWLKHGSVNENMSEERIVLSFNTAFHPYEPGTAPPSS